MSYKALVDRLVIYVHLRQNNALRYFVEIFLLLVLYYKNTNKLPTYNYNEF